MRLAETMRIRSRVRCLLDAAMEMAFVVETESDIDEAICDFEIAEEL